MNLREEFRLDWLYVAAFAVMAMLAFGIVGIAPANAQQKVDPKYDRVTCWAWGGSGSSGQEQYLSCPTTVVEVVKTEVREVRVPVPVPGPVQRIEVPAPVVKPIRE